MQGHAGIGTQALKTIGCSVQNIDREGFGRQPNIQSRYSGHMRITGIASVTCPGIVAIAGSADSVAGFRCWGCSPASGVHRRHRRRSACANRARLGRGHLGCSSQRVAHRKTLPKLGAGHTGVAARTYTFFLFPAMGQWLARVGRASRRREPRALARLTETTNSAAYVVVGTVLWMWMNMALWDSGIFFRQEQMRGTLDNNWMTPACSWGRTLQPVCRPGDDEHRHPRVQVPPGSSNHGLALDSLDSPALRSVGAGGAGKSSGTFALSLAGIGCGRYNGTVVNPACTEGCGGDVPSRLVAE